MAGEADVTIDTITVERLYRLVRDAFAADEDIPAEAKPSVVYGRSQVTQQVNQGAGRANRIVFVPGDDGGKGGEVVGSMGGTGHPQRAATHRALFQIRLWARSSALGAGEDDHVDALKSLFFVTYNKVRDEAMGRWRVKDERYAIAPVERVFGAELTLICELDEPVIALPLATIPAQPAEEPAVTGSLVFPAGEVVVCQPPEESP